MLGNFDPPQEPLFWSQTQKYQDRGSLITTLPYSEQISPFQYVNIHDSKFVNVNHGEENSLISSKIQSEGRAKNNPENFLYEEVKPKEYKQRPFAKIQVFRSEQIQILVPIKSHRTQFTYIDKIDYSSINRSPRVEDIQPQGARKKKITVISKSHIFSPKVA